jgi:hypothetical protein
MTPKEKAQELVDKFRLLAHTEWNEWQGYDTNSNWQNAKQCALIAVDEIIGCTDWTRSDFLWKDLLYWQQVKTEIQNL